MDDCIFCRIVAKTVPATVVHETETTLAFRDLKPESPVHVLVIPKTHVPAVMSLAPQQDAVLGDVHRTIQEVARREKIDKSGFRVVVNNGSDANQTVPHLHYHVLGGRKLAWPPG